MRTNDMPTFDAAELRRADHHASNKQGRPQTNAERHAARQRRGERHQRNILREMQQLERAGAL